jgi:hypothetical protein
MSPKHISIKQDNVFIGGVYCNSISEQALVLEKLAKKKNVVKFIKQYTQASYMNDYLRGSIEASSKKEYDKAVKVLYALTDLFNKIPYYEPRGYTILYRGSFTECSLMSKDTGFMSTTTEESVAKNFGYHVMKIYLLKGYQYKMLPIENITARKNEWEVILAPNRGTFFQCGQSYQIHEEPQDNNEALSNAESNAHSSAAEPRIWTFTEFVYVPTESASNCPFGESALVNDMLLQRFTKENKKDRTVAVKKYNTTFGETMCKLLATFNKNKVAPYLDTMENNANTQRCDID